MAVEAAALYFKSGGSDKEYHASIEEVQGKGYVVNFAYGRRGTTLTPGTKTQQPVSLADAKDVFTKLVGSKEAKGYTIDGEGTPFAMTDKAGEVSSVASLPQLLNQVDDEELKGLIFDDEFGMQQKEDGKRIQVRIDQGVLEGSNRKGLVVSLPQEVVDSLKDAPICQLDGELVGTVYHVFDLMALDGRSITGVGFGNRHNELTKLRRKFGLNVKIVPVYYGSVIKDRELERLKAEAREGVVFKRLDSEYSAGRPNSGGDQLKYKFYETCSAIVDKVNKQRSVGLRCGVTKIGNVTILPNFDVPKKGDVVEVRYLYYNKGGALYQPVYLGVRDDMGHKDCTMDQLKEKGE